MDLAHQSMTNLLFEENIQRALSGIYTSFLNPKLRLGELRYLYLLQLVCVIYVSCMTGCVHLLEHYIFCT